ncbi:TrbC/VirB2 family protein [Rickettsia endosymbiont of Halotydeus destructor]|uniref:TrbC/VirB2 family protein n=1 Tax=Rickettsia endosymbiont of Halotydeus destructor TaxID=2996754 RepID=UPI003BAED56C
MNFKKLNTEPLEQDVIVRLLLAFLGLAIIMMSFDSFASDATATADPVGNTLCKLISTFQGNTARAIAIIGIIVLGIQTLRGKLQWEVAIVIITAIIILFKAQDIVSVIAGSGTCTTG